MSEGDPPSVTDDEAKSDALDALISEKEVEDGTSAASFIHQLQIVAQAGGRIEELFVRVEALERENGELRNILKQYLDGISVNEDVINNPGNPLLVVNNKLHLTVEPQRQEVPHTVVEASHVVQVQRL